MQTILVIDRDPHYREYLRLVLERAGYAVRALADGSTLRQTLAAGPIDAVVVDIDPLGDAAGEVIEPLRALAPDLPVIAMSGDNPGPRTSRRLGVRVVIAKPARSHDIIAALMRAMVVPPR
jgi:DNA-binding NtrC family response regulator